MTGWRNWAEHQACSPVLPRRYPECEGFAAVRVRLDPGGMSANRYVSRELCRAAGLAA